jgi:Zn-dependent metalloprotease
MSKLRRFIQVIYSSIIILTLGLSAIQPQSVSAQSGDGIKRQINAESGKISFIGPENGRSVSAARALGTFIRPQDPALELAKRFAPEFGLVNAEQNLSVKKSDELESGRLRVRYQQKYQGIPVMGGELIVNTNTNGDLYSINGEVSPKLTLSTQPTIDSEQAEQTALQAIAKWYQKTLEDLLVSEPELWIFDESLLRSSNRVPELVWRMEVTSADKSMPVRELVLVHAQRGNISLHFNQIDTAWHSSESAHPIQSPDSRNSELNVDMKASQNLANAPHVLVAATWYVATTGNDSNSCSATGSPCLTINGAISKAANGDTIKVAAGAYTGTGTEVVLINKSVMLSGGWNAGFTAQSGISTIDGQEARGGVVLSGGAISTIDLFKVQNGSSCQGGGIRVWAGGTTLTLNNSSVINNNNNPCTGGGGGIRNSGNTSLNNSTVSDNIGNGGIYNSGTLTINNSTISGNYNGGYGGGIENINVTTLNNSTVSDNSVTFNGGGGIYNHGTLILNNSTISRNNATNSEGGGLLNDGTVNIQNTILALNVAISGPDCTGTVFGPGTISSSGYNLIGNNADCTFTQTTGDLIGTSVNPINPHLTLLQDNGGPTFTHALMFGSPAINSGNPTTPGSADNACLETDQRGNTRPIGGSCDIGAYEGSVAATLSPYVDTYTAHGSPYSYLPGTFLCKETDPSCSSGDSHAKAAHKFAIDTYNFYATEHGRDSMDNNGMTIVSTVNYCNSSSCPYYNAFWDGTQLVYGNGYGFPLADDVVAHEFTHGVTQYESNLFYYYQSGAINESFSDLWGEYYDQSNGLGNDTTGVKWLLGEDISGLGANRSMINPPAFGDPDKMSSANYYEGEDDSGGVHTNSGVNNKAVYLMVDGGTFNNKTVTALGWTKTAAIYYKAQTDLLTSGSDYSDLYYGLQQACTNLIGQNGITASDCIEVKDAIDAVEMNSQPAPNFNVDAPLCDAGTLPTYTFTDDIEAGTSNWTFSNGWYTRWQLDSSLYGSYAQSGIHSLYADDYPDVITDASARLAAFTVPVNGYMHFAHAYDFEDYLPSGPYYFDGGVLEYSTNGGASWLDASSLIDSNGYRGVVFTGAGNPLSGRTAFVGSSHGYISTRLNLNGLVGKSVTFRWRMGLDEGTFSGGWWVDNIKVYSCIHPNHNIDVTVGSTLTGRYYLPVGSSMRQGFSGVDNGPVKIESTNSADILAALRVIWKEPGFRASYSEMMGLPVEQLSSEYWFPWYNNAMPASMDQGFRIGNVNVTSTAIQVWVGTTLIDSFTLNPGASVRVGYPVDSGPVRIVCTDCSGSEKIIAALRVIWQEPGKRFSYSEMMGLPKEQLSDEYWFPWYNNAAPASLDQGFRIANVDTSSSNTVEVWVGNTKLDTINLNPGASTRVGYNVDNGPIRIFCTTCSNTGMDKIIAALRVIWKEPGFRASYSEMMGLPKEQLSDEYWFPWYNNAVPASMDQGFRIANVSLTESNTVEVWVGTTKLATIPLAAGASTRVGYNVDNGPIRIVCTTCTNSNYDQILAALRVIWKEPGFRASYSEMMGLPAQALSTEYWFPWYNFAAPNSMDQGFRIAVP